ncbi:MAG: PAS domain S-box protein [Candidatus Aceula lacicola]|nr:PAS domain S-box protein [Candidatus Aceula lacicola]
MAERMVLMNKSVNLLRLGFFQYQLKPKEKFLDANQSFVRISGCTSLQLLKRKTLSQIITNAKDYSEFIKVLNKKKQVKDFKTTILGKTKKPIWVLISARLVQEKRNSRYLDGVVQDISLVKSESDRLLHEMDFLQSFLDHMPDAIYFKDVKSRATKVNKFYAQGFKMKPEEIVGKTDYDFFPKDQAQKMIEDDQRVIKTGIPIIGKIERTLLPNGTWNQVITTKVPIYDRKGKTIGTMGVTRDMTEHANLEKDRFAMLMNALTVLNKAFEMRDPYTFSHARNVGRIASVIGEKLGFSENRLMGLRLAADLHDLGKLSVPLDILTKPGKLSGLEYGLIQEHVEKCHDLIKEMKFPFALSEIVYQHHERLDGSGYPKGLKGSKILFEARILAVSDVLESMTSHRPYRAALGIKKAMQELKSGAGKKYDSKIVNTVEEIIKKNKGQAFWSDEK